MFFQFVKFAWRSSNTGFGAWQMSLRPDPLSTLNLFCPIINTFWLVIGSTGKALLAFLDRRRADAL